MADMKTAIAMLLVGLIWPSFLQDDLRGVYPNQWWKKGTTREQVNAVVNKLMQPGIHTVRADGVIVPFIDPNPFRAGDSTITLSNRAKSRAEVLRELRDTLEVIRRNRSRCDARGPQGELGQEISLHTNHLPEQDTNLRHTG
jgi:hypothetical protein